jgi:two-component system cell cycle sensor histidine kinase/response regulator CckA
VTHESERGIILVVDDNLDNLKLVRKLLEMAGYTVLAAADGDEGLRLYEQHESKIVLLLTDVVMPKINGFQLADRILGMDSQKPVLLMSGDAECSYRDLECIAKPFRPNELIETVSRVLSANVQSEKERTAA